MREGGGIRQRIVGSVGTVALSPAGIREDYCQISNPIDEMMHIYLAPRPFAAVAEYSSRDLGSASVDYDAGFRDPLIECIAVEIGRELQNETSCGDLLVETLADALAVRLLKAHSSVNVKTPVSHRERGLDARRLQRTVDYIHANLTKEITVDELAAVASLSRFHFSRMFKTATGQSPSRFIGRLRLELAKSLLAEGVSITNVAYSCRFSSESNFTRSFRRATGLTPGQHRDLAEK